MLVLAFALALRPLLSGDPVARLFAGAPLGDALVRNLTRSGARSLTRRSSAARVQPGTDLLIRGTRPFEVAHIACCGGVAFPAQDVAVFGA